MLFEISHGFLLTLSSKQISIVRRSHGELLGCGEATAVQEDGQVHYVAHVVVAIDVGITQHAVQVLVDGFDDDVGVAGKDGDEGALGEENPHLQGYALGPGFGVLPELNISIVFFFSLGWLLVSFKPI